MSIDLEIERVVDKYADMIYKIALSYLENKDDAEDIVQDVMIKYISFIRKNKFKDINHERYWIVRVTMNLCCNEAKSARRTRNINYEEYMSDSIEYIDDNNEILELIRKLKDKYRTVFELFYIHDMKITDIAKTLNISESNVKIRLMRAKKKIQEYLKIGE